MKERLLSILEKSRTYTLSVADAMPESSFNTQLIRDSWEFGDLLNHIAYGIQWWDSNVIKKIVTEWEEPATPTNKEDIMMYIHEGYDMVKRTIEESEISDDLINNFNSTLDHITHHRGQAVLFLRKNNITPPEYDY
ncbi:MAG: DinB family protein [Bacteroidota bacterium]